MKCERCQNEDPIYFYRDQDTWYCRKCVHFGRIDVGNKPVKLNYQKKYHNCKYYLDYELTAKQKEAMLSLRELVKNKQKVLVYAACGAGKTEIVMEQIQEYLNAGKKVGYAISRRQVVLEIAERMQHAFQDVRVIRVCEGFTKICDGDIIVCTMHQLYRYYQTFDLLIMDEIDAFPYAGNKMLESIAQAACVGETIFLTATPSDDLLDSVDKGELKIVELFMRPHGFPLIVPKIQRIPNVLQSAVLFYYMKQHIKEKIPLLVFVPTIAIAKQLHKVFRLFFACQFVTSQSEEKEMLMENFKQKKFLILIATTILERGITISGVNVIVYRANHSVFNEASLIQMIGRVGRKKEQPKGNAYMIGSVITKDMKRCHRAILKMNEDGANG